MWKPAVKWPMVITCSMCRRPVSLVTWPQSHQATTSDHLIKHISCWAQLHRVCSRIVPLRWNTFISHFKLYTREIHQYNSKKKLLTHEIVFLFYTFSNTFVENCSHLLNVCAAFDVFIPPLPLISFHAIGSEEGDNNWVNWLYTILLQMIAYKGFIPDIWENQTYQLSKLAIFAFSFSQWLFIKMCANFC